MTWDCAKRRKNLRWYNLLMSSLKNKIIAITGASQGLGEEIAYLAADEGAKVALIARSEDLLAKVQMKIQRNGGKAKPFICDIQQPADISETVQAIEDEFGEIDILINNAGIWTDNELEQIEPALRKQAFDTNALGHINFIYEVLPKMKKKNKGYIFNVISTAGFNGIPEGNNVYWKAYGATKWAMTGFTKSLREELADTKIKITGFFPGGFDSNLYENANRDNPHNQPWMMKTKDVAEIVLFALTRPDDVCMTEIVTVKK